MRILIAAAIAAVLFVAPLSAHDRYRIVGTVTKVTVNEITVKQLKDNALVEMDHDRNTKVTRLNNKAGTIADVKVGASVVVDALGDSILDLAILQIKMVPALPATGKPR